MTAHATAEWNDDNGIGHLLDLIYGEDQPWRQHAACKGMDPDLFFPERGESQKQAKQVCASCPVRAECADFGLDEFAGIWGGQAERKRRRMRQGTPRQVAKRGDGFAPVGCGTDAGYRRHLRAGTAPCMACQRAHMQRNAERRFLAG